MKNLIFILCYSLIVLAAGCNNDCPTCPDQVIIVQSPADSVGYLNINFQNCGYDNAEYN